MNDRIIMLSGWLGNYIYSNETNCSQSTKIKSRIDDVRSFLMEQPQRLEDNLLKIVY
jgi:hypothetical protein